MRAHRCDLKQLGLNLGDRKRLLKAIATLDAACIGREFDYSLLTAVVDRLERQLHAALDKLKGLDLKPPKTPVRQECDMTGGSASCLLGCAMPASPQPKRELRNWPIGGRSRRTRGGRRLLSQRALAIR